MASFLHKFLYKGAFAETGQAAAFKVSRNVAAVRTYALTGQDVLCKPKRALAYGAFTLTAQGSGALAHTVHA